MTEPKLPELLLQSRDGTCWSVGPNGAVVGKDSRSMKAEAKRLRLPVDADRWPPVLYIQIENDSEISRAHAGFTCSVGEHFCIEDLGSSNGTKLNEDMLCERKKKSVPHPLSVGDTLMLGQQQFTVQAANAGDPSPEATLEDTNEATLEVTQDATPPFDCQDGTSFGGAGEEGAPALQLPSIFFSISVIKGPFAGQVSRVFELGNQSSGGGGGGESAAVI